MGAFDEKWLIFHLKNRIEDIYGKLFKAIEDERHCIENIKKSNK